jgi:hypothetical protein
MTRAETPLLLGILMACLCLCLCLRYTTNAWARQKRAQVQTVDRVVG